MEGLVTFPSFHTTLGILIVYAVRDFKVLAIFVGALNAVMIVATMPEGGHHLVDVLAGAGVALASISTVRYAVRSRQYATTLVKEVS
jgi:membrane-associated phospholipid phosphatase